MAATTTSAILDRFERVLQSPPLSLTLSRVPFGDATLEPNLSINTTFQVMSMGLVNNRPQSGNWEARIDRIAVRLYQRLDMDGYLAQRTLEDMCDAVAMALFADGPDHDYYAQEEKGSRKIQLPKKSDVLHADIQFLVDYDWNAA